MGESTTFHWVRNRVLIKIMKKSFKNSFVYCIDKLERKIELDVFNPCTHQSSSITSDIAPIYITV